MRRNRGGPTYGGALGQVGVALVFGLVIMVMVYATGHLSGAHVNPAVTLAFTTPVTSPCGRPRLRHRAVHRRDRGGSGVVAIWPDQPAHWGRRCRASGRQRLVYEVVLTAFLMFVIMAVATDTRAVGAAAAIAIGGTIGSMLCSPARSPAPR